MKPLVNNSACGHYRVTDGIANVASAFTYCGVKRPNVIISCHIKVQCSSIEATKIIFSYHMKMRGSIGCMFEYDDSID